MPKVVKITKEDTMMTRMVNSLQHTLRRLGTSLNFGISPDGKRNYNTIFGYGEDLSYADLFGMYERSAIGKAVISKVAKACWNEIPKITSNDTEILKEELEILNKMGFFRALERADILNRIGNFSVLLIGIPDGMDLNQPLGSANNMEGMYFNPYNFDGIEILKWDDDPISKRFGLPVEYQLQTTSFGEKKKDIQTSSIIVHFSRIIHLAEGALDSSVEGSSSIKAIWNNLINTLKIVGGSGEAFFRNARQQLALEADKDAKLDPGSQELSNLKDNIEAYGNGWEQVLRLQNMKAHNLQIQMISPRDSFDVNMEEISGETGIPIRVLTGKGGGQTTGSEDRASWNAVIFDRRSTECNNYLFQGLEIIQEAGLLELPDNAVIEWPPQASLNEKEQSEVNEHKASTFDKIITALAKPVGDEADIKMVLEAVGLEDIEIDESAIDDKDIDDLQDKEIKPEDLSDANK